MVFANPTPLIAIPQILCIVAAEAPGYSLTAVSNWCLLLLPPWLRNVQENCWFFASIIEEVFIKYFGAQYASGSLHQPRLARDRRASILNQVKTVIICYWVQSWELWRGSANPWTVWIFTGFDYRLYPQGQAASYINLGKLTVYSNSSLRRPRNRGCYPELSSNAWFQFGSPNWTTVSRTQCGGRHVSPLTYCIGIYVCTVVGQVYFGARASKT